MLTHPMLDQFAQLGLTGMAQAFAELEASGEGATLAHADWLGLLVDREMTHRRDKRLAARLRYARLRHQASGTSTGVVTYSPTQIQKVGNDEFGNQPVGARDQLTVAIRRSEIGVPVPVTVLRRGRQLVLQATPIDQPER